MKKAACFMLFALCASAQATDFATVAKVVSEAHRESRTGDPYPEASTSDLAAVAAASRAKPKEIMEPEYNPVFERPDGSKIGYKPWISVRNIEDVTEGELTEEYKETFTDWKQYGGDVVCTYPKGGVSVQVERGNPSNYIPYMTSPTAPYECESAYWRRGMDSDGTFYDSRRFDSWDAITYHWKQANKAVSDGAKDSGGVIIGIADAIVNYPLFGVPVMCGVAWLARRQWRRRVAEEKQAKEQQQQ